MIILLAIYALTGLLTALLSRKIYKNYYGVRKIGVMTTLLLLSGPIGLCFFVGYHLSEIKYSFQGKDWEDVNIPDEEEREHFRERLRNMNS